MTFPKVGSTNLRVGDSHGKWLDVLPAVQS